MKRIGRKIYYDNQTGNVILMTSEMMGNVRETTKEQDFASYTVLNERNPETIGVIQLEYGQYQTDFANSNSFQVNLDTLTLEFDYFEVVEPHKETIEEKIERLERRLQQDNLIQFEVLATIYEELLMKS